MMQTRVGLFYRNSGGRHVTGFTYVHKVKRFLLSVALNVKKGLVPE